MLIFGGIGETQIIAEMNISQNKFARETKILQQIGDLQSLTSQVSWALPSDFVRLYEVELYDTNSKELSKINETIDWVIDNNRLIFFSTEQATNGTVTKITSIPTAIGAILVRYSILPTTIVLRATNQTDDIPTQFRPAIFYGALATLYGRIKQSVLDSSGNAVLMIDRDTRNYWEAKFKEQVREAKKYINSQDSTVRRVVNYQHAGAQRLPREAKDTNLTVTSWS